MISLLATRYQKQIAFLLFLLFDSSFMFTPLAYARSGKNNSPSGYPTDLVWPQVQKEKMGKPIDHTHIASVPNTASKTMHPSIGGPSQPEMSSFKPVNASNMVNLFSGDFNYNIPLLDVGGYPVNMYYGGGIGLEQEASWVGLGWNINPGNINRNMRGIPDDFDGTDTLIQSQNMKPNKTWGVSVGADLEGVGIKALSIGGSVGMSFNNYLGPALDFGVKGGLNFKVMDKVLSEKSATDSLGSGMGLNLGLNVAANVNSREGLTVTPSLSLTANGFAQNASFSEGTTIATSYNSRSGIKALQISEQTSMNSREQERTGVIGNYGSIGSALFSTTISFARPSYIPAIRMPMSNDAFSGRFQLGGAIFGIYGNLEAEVYKQTSKVTPGKIIQRKPMVGYLYYEKAMNNPEAVMDFTRFNDKEVTPHTPIISAPQYSYDVFTIQGEGTGGSIRAYRNDLGFVRDNHTGSQDQSEGIGVDIGIPGHYGANFNIISTPSEIQEWTAGNKLHDALAFSGRLSGNKENVYFRNPGEACVTDNTLYNRIGGTDLVRFQLSGDHHNPAIEPLLDRFSKAGILTGNINAATTTPAQGRRKRTQVIDFLTAADASVVGLDKMIKSYDYQTVLDAGTNTLRYTTIPRQSGYRKPNHISQINVTESNGKRYIYGIPAYNVRQKDFIFTISNSSLASPSSTDKVSYATGENSLANPALAGNTGSRDGYVEITETPAYAHSFLLSGLLSPDYVDVTGDGISDDDLGEAIKFNYSQIKQSDGNPAVHAWRTPADANGNMANFNPGKRTELKDDKGLISYGERESWYLHSIESRTMIALFTLEDRLDGKGVLATADPTGQLGQNAGINSADASLKRLRQIDLYSKSDLKMNGLSKAKPIKTVHFAYSYHLCTGTPDNPVGDATGKGKLTLDSVYFTYNGQNRANKNKYIFSYGTAASDNPSYTFNASDRWGTYKPVTMNPVDKTQPNMKNSDYPFTPQERPGQTISPRAALDQNAGAWSLKAITLPSGGEMDIQYESDDYAYVQNRRAAEMMNITGFSNTPTGTISNRLYDIVWGSVIENSIVFIQVAQPCANDAEVATRYLQGMTQLAMKIGVDMPSGIEYITCYANIVASGKRDATTIWVQLKNVSGISPLSLTAVEYLREQLPGQAFPGYDVSEQSGLEQIGTELASMLASLKNAFKDPVSALRNGGKAQTVELGQSFARLNDPLGFKYGGGHRVKSIALKDNWKAMTQQFTSVYTQTYDYTTTETFNGALRTISSGVASYEPSVGGEENPFQTIVQVADKLPLGPASYGALEMPVLEAFFPAAGIGYSKVTVRSIPSAPPGSNQKSRSGIGRQVTQFYTAKDFPVYYNQTGLDPSTDLQAHDASTLNFFYKYAFDSRALSQGFIVETNDMHGKLRSQTSYADNDTTIRVNYSENFYRNTGVNGLNETFNMVSSAQGGVISPGNIGIDIELMTDTRQFTVSSSSLEVQGQLDLFPVYFPFWLPFIWPVTGNSENDYRAVTTTKVINYHAMLDSVVVYDKGSQVSTKNLVYDSETGDVIVNRTNNEFNQPVYNTNYPAWWAYAGMGPAYVNTGATFNNLTFSDGRITGGTYDPTLMESGDELYLTNLATTSSCPAVSTPAAMIWNLDLSKNNPPFPISNTNFIFIDSVGNPYTHVANVRILRSGYRNMLDAKLANVTSLSSPIVPNGSFQQLRFPTGSQVTNATAVEFSEKWQTDKDAFRTYTTVFDPNSCTSTETPDCKGHLERTMNPYRKGLLGNFRNFRSLVFYANRAETDPTTTTNLPKNGFLSNFSLYWDFNTSNQLVPNTTNTFWIENIRTNRVNARGEEMETKNALNIYTSAQYGYNKTLPIAITNNSPYSQSLYEGFEDYNYNQSISNNSANPCPLKQLDFTSLTNTNVINTDTLTFTAHTGKYCLALAHNSSGSLSVPISAADNLNYTLTFGSTTAKSLNNPGGNIGTLTYTNYTLPPIVNVTFSNGGFGADVPPGTTDATGNYNHSITVPFSYYISVPTKTTYGVAMEASMGLRDGNDLPPGSYNFGVDMLVNINGVDNGFSTTIVSPPPTPPGSSLPGVSVYNGTITLCPGIYLISGHMDDFYVGFNHAPKNEQGCTFTFSISTNLTDYQSLSTASGCTSTVPIPGDATMLNPVFSMRAGQKMLFSAWVRDGQPATPYGVTDTAVTYNNSQVQIYDGAQYNNLTPQGPVIEGWQRYEGTFTPAASGTGSINFINSGPNTLYIDDIRMHPFNADMKSYVYDPVNLRLVAQLDANNYATFYEYDEEGTLTRTKAETSRGIKTIKETRSAKQKNILADQSQNGNSCGTNCVVAVMHTLAGTNTLGYPVGVFNANGKLLGNATTASQFMSLWNADATNASLGTLSAGIDPLHFQLTLIPGKTAPSVTGCRYYQVDLAWNKLDGIRNFDGTYVDFGDGTGMRLGKSFSDVPAIIAPNTTYTIIFGGDFSTNETYFVHTYPDASLKTLTFYHNDATESEDFDNEGPAPTGLNFLTNLRGYLPQNTITIGGSCYQMTGMTSVAAILNWNSISSIQYFRLNNGDGANPAMHINYAQDFMKNNQGLLSIYTGPSYYRNGCRDTDFKLSRLKSNWNTYFTSLTSIRINDDQWNREDLTALTQLNYFQIYATTQNHQDDTNSPLVPIPSTAIDNIINQIAAGAGRMVNNGFIYIFSGGTTRTSASDNAVNLLQSKGWTIYAGQ